MAAPANVNRWFLLAVLLVVLPVTLVLFAIDASMLGPLLVIGAFATPGLAASCTWFGAMTVRTGTRDLLLAVVLFPLLAPTLLAAVAATRDLLGGAPLSQLGDYIQLMAVFDFVFTAGGLSTFGTLVEPWGSNLSRCSWGKALRRKDR